MQLPRHHRPPDHDAAVLRRLGGPAVLALVLQPVPDPDGGAAWALSIVGLTLVIRTALIPLFVKQIKSSRNMQLLQPKVKELQKKYGHDRERLAQETMKLYKETGTNPFASCLPLLVQSPIFLALFRLLDQAPKNDTANGFMTRRRPTSLRERRALRDDPDLGDLHPQPTAPGQRQDRRRDPGRRDDGDHVHHPAPADEQEHAGRRAERARTPSSRRCCSTSCRSSSPSVASPSRSVSSSTGRPQPVDDGPAVLRDPQQPGPRHAGVRRQGDRDRAKGKRERAAQQEPTRRPVDGSPRPAATAAAGTQPASSARPRSGAGKPPRRASSATDERQPPADGEDTDEPPSAGRLSSRPTKPHEESHRRPSRRRRPTRSPTDDAERVRRRERR